jgi:threonine dehydratase
MDDSVARAVQVTASDVLAAQARLRRYLNPTPLHYAERFGCWLKLENLQRTGSYKVRGAMNALLAARERGDTRPVIAASAGNHAQGLAWAAYRLGMPAIAVMPQTAPDTKVAGVAHWGAAVRLHGDTYDEAKAFAAELAAQHGYRCCRLRRSRRDRRTRARSAGTGLADARTWCSCRSAAAAWPRASPWH